MRGNLDWSANCRRGARFADAPSGAVPHAIGNVKTASYSSSSLADAALVAMDQALADQAGILANLSLDLVGNVLVLGEECLGILAALADTLPS